MKHNKYKLISFLLSCKTLKIHILECRDLQKNNQVTTDAENSCMDHIQSDWTVLKDLLDCSDEVLLYYNY